MRSMFLFDRFLIRLFFLWSLLFAGLVQANIEVSRPLTDDGGPIRIQTAVFAVDIDEINSADQTFTINLFYQFEWKDARLAHTSEENRQYPLDEIWHPNLQLVNQQKVWETLPRVVLVAGDGTVTYRQRVWGAFSQRLDLRAFPFDQQKFDVIFTTVGMVDDAIVFEPSSPRSSGIADVLSLPDWTLISFSLDPGVYEPVPGDRANPAITFSFTAQRASDYYVIKVIIPLLMILVMATVVFWIDPTEGGIQIGVSTSAMLTLIAYRFAVGADLPKIPYLTRMDSFILVSTIMVAFGLVEVVITSHLAKTKRVHIARRIDWVMRIIFPGLVILMGIWAIPWDR